MSRDKGYWFPAKRGFGWGWGIPACWQGWAVLAAFVAAVLGDQVLFSPNTSPAAYYCVLAVATAALVAICWAKGEPPRWRWGRD